MWKGEGHHLAEREGAHCGPFLSPRHGAINPEQSLRPLSSVIQTPVPALRKAAVGGALQLQSSQVRRQNIAPLGQGIGRRRLSLGGLNVDLTVRPSRVATEDISPRRSTMDGPPKLVHRPSNEFYNGSTNIKDLSNIMSNNVLLRRGAEPVHEFARISLNSKPGLMRMATF